MLFIFSFSCAFSASIFFTGCSNQNPPSEQGQENLQTPEDGIIEAKDTKLYFKIIPVLWTTNTNYIQVNASSSHTNEADRSVVFSTQWVKSDGTSETFSSGDDEYYSAWGMTASSDKTYFRDIKYLNYNYSHGISYPVSIKVTMSKTTYNPSAVEIFGASGSTPVNTSNTTVDSDKIVYLYGDSSSAKVSNSLTTSSIIGSSSNKVNFYLIYRTKYTYNFYSQDTLYTSTSGYAGIGGSAPSAPTRTGYTFANWKNSAGGIALGSGSVSAAYSHYTRWDAQWTANNYTVTFNANGGSLPSGTSSTKQVTYGSTYGTLPTPTRTGYTFNGWGVTSSSTVSTASNHTLTASWTANSYTLTCNAAGGTISSGSSWTGSGTSVTKSVTYDSTYGTLPTPTRTGYTFNGWAGNMVVNGTSTVTNSTDYCFFSSALNQDLESYTTYAFSMKIKLSSVPSADDWVSIYLDGGWVPVASKADVSTSWVTWNGTFKTQDVSSYTHGGTKAVWLYNGPSSLTSSKPISMEYFSLYKMTDATYIGSSPSTSTAIVSSSSTVKTTAAHTIYASWTVNTYNVDFDTMNYYANFTGPYFNLISGTHSSTTTNGIKETSVTFSAASSGSSGFWVTASTKPTPGTYRWSVQVKSSNAVSITLGKEGVSSGYMSVGLTTSYQTFTKQFTTSSTLNQAFIFYSSTYTSGTTITFKNLTLQRVEETAGGENIFANHTNPSYNYITGSSTILDSSTKETQVTFTANAASVGYGFYVSGSRPLAAGEKYIWSVDVKASSAINIQGIGHEQNGRKSAYITTSYQTITHTFIANSSRWTAFTFYSSDYKNGMSVTFKNLSVRRLQSLKADNAVSSRTITFGSSVDTLPTASRAGWTFEGWYHEYRFNSYIDSTMLSSYNTYRFYESGKTNGGNNLQIGDRVYLSVAFSSLTGLKTIDILDVYLTQGVDYIISGNTVVINYLIKTDPHSHCGKYSFVDFVFSDNSDRAPVVNQFYFMLQYGDDSGSMTRNMDFVDGMLYSYWTPLQATVNVDFRFVNTLTGSSQDSATASGFSFMLSYESTTLDVETNLPTVISKTITEMDDGVLTGIRQYQRLTISNMVTPKGWAFYGCDLYVGETVSGFGWSANFNSATTRNIENSVRLYLYFKVVSDNILKYDPIDQYFYFEDGQFPQTAVVTYDESFNAFLTQLTPDNTFTQNVDGEEIVFKTLLYRYKSEDSSSVSAALAYDGQKFLGFEMPSTRTVSLKNDASSRTFSAGVTYWFRYDPIRWRVSDYGVSSTALPEHWNFYLEGQMNVQVVSDVLWWDALNDSSNTSFGVGNYASETSLMQKLGSNTLLDGDSMNLKYSNLSTPISLDKFNNEAFNDKVTTASGAYWNEALLMRYVRLTSNGSNANEWDHFTFLKIEKKDGTVTTVADATTDTVPTVYSGYCADSGSYFSTGDSPVAFDLGELIQVTGICLYRLAGRTYYGQKIEYSTDGENWYTYWDSNNKGSYTSPDDTNLYAETSAGRWFRNGRARLANLEEIQTYQTDLRSYASQLVCVLLGENQNEYFEYWTRDLGQQLGCGTYVTDSGQIMKNTWATKQKGVRFAITMLESSYDGNVLENLYDWTACTVTNGTVASGVFDMAYTNSSSATTWANYFNNDHEIELEKGANYLYVLEVTQFKTSAGPVLFNIGDTSETAKSELSYATITVAGVGYYSRILTALADDITYSHRLRDFISIPAGKELDITFKVYLYKL